MSISTSQRRALSAVLTVTVGALALAACAPDGPDPASGDYVNPGTGLDPRDTAHLPADWDEIVAAAAQEGEVVVFTTVPEAVTSAQSAAFAEAFPDIEIRYVRDSVDVLATRYEEERNSLGTSSADVLESTQFASLAVKHPEWFIDLAADGPELIPTLNDLLSNAVPEDRPSQVTASAYVRGVVYNTDSIDESELPDSWCDFADPKWANRGVIQNPAASSSPMFQQSILYDICGEEFTEALKTNGYGLDDSPDSIAQMVAAGAYEFGFFLAAVHSAEVRAQGAPVKMWFPSEPAMIGGTWSSFPTDAPNPNAQRVYATFMLGALAQEIQCEAGELGTMNTLAGGACVDLEVPEDGVMSIGSLQDEAKREAILAALGLN